MSLHDDIVQDIRRRIEDAERSRAAFISPSAIAHTVHAEFAHDDEDEHVTYCSIEHIKHLARKELGRKLDADSDENSSMQGDMFSGSLQEHYPTQVARGEEPQYVRRDLLSIEQLDYNIACLRKSARARLEHADALS